MNKTKWTASALAGALWLLAATGTRAQGPEKLTLKRAVALALQNSRELALARAQQTVGEKGAGVYRSLFRPNLYTGSGAAYSSGFPQTPGGAAPSVFNLSYVQTVFSPPLRGQLRAAEDRAEVQRLGVERTRDAVILRTVSAYLELGKVRHSLNLLRAERESAGKILEVTRERSREGLELPIEVTRGELSLARIEQRIVRHEGREEVLERELRSLTGLPPAQRIEATPEDFPVLAEPPVHELVELALANNIELKQAEYERRAWEHRLQGERGGYWPSVDVVGHYGIFSRINNFDEFFRRFDRHNLNLGVQVRIPIFSARTSAAVAEAQSELTAADLEWKNKRADLETEVRRQARRVRELDSAREVARLELKLAQENLRLLQARFEEGRVNLRDLEQARLEENDRWMGFLDANYERQQAQLELLKTAGQLPRVFQ